MSRDLLIELVSHYSPSEQEADAVAYLVDWMNQNGFSAYTDAVGNAVGIRGNPDAQHTLVLLGHIDTVPGEIPVEMRDGTMVGRGSVDAKGSLCAFASAASVASIPPEWRIVVVGAVEEEASSKGAHFIRDQFQPDLCIIGEPSGAERITLGYKGHILLDYCIELPMAHTARVEQSAAARASAFWQQILKWTDEQNADVQGYFHAILPRLRQINSDDDGFRQTAKATVGFRLPPSLSPNELITAISNLADPEFELRFYGMVPAYQGGKNNELVRQMLVAIRSQGLRPGFVLKTGTSDMNLVGERWTCPIIAYGPGDSNLDHTPNEHISLDEYDLSIAILQVLIENLNTT